MSRGPRIFVSFLIAVLIAAGVLKYTKAPPEAYMPPPSLYQFATAKTHGYVTGTRVSGYGEHLFEGSSDFYYMAYKFQPKPLGKVTYLDNGSVNTRSEEDTAWYTGEVRITQYQMMPGVGDQYQPGDIITVAYDPLDPRVNGVPGTLGVWSRTTGYWNPYLWWYAAFFAGVYIIQEIIRMATRTNDFRP